MYVDQELQRNKRKRGISGANEGIGTGSDDDAGNNTTCWCCANHTRCSSSDTRHLTTGNWKREHNKYGTLKGEATDVGTALSVTTVGIAAAAGIAREAGATAAVEIVRGGWQGSGSDMFGSAAGAARTSTATDDGGGDSSCCTDKDKTRVTPPSEDDDVGCNAAASSASRVAGITCGGSGCCKGYRYGVVIAACHGNHISRVANMCVVGEFQQAPTFLVMDIMYCVTAHHTLHSTSPTVANIIQLCRPHRLRNSL